MKSHDPATSPSREVTQAPYHMMWRARQLSFGGLSHRYRRHRRRCVRMIDPFTAALMEFSTPLQADNWLLRAFCPDVLSTQVPPNGLQYVKAGRVRSLPCHLVTVYSDGVQINDLVVKDKASAEAAWSRFEQVSIALGAVPQLRTLQDIRGNTVLLANLDRMCQHLITHDLVDQACEDRVLAQLPSQGHLARQQLGSELESHCGASAIDSALFRLFRKGLVDIDVVEIPYGPSSRISRR